MSIAKKPRLGRLKLRTGHLKQPKTPPKLKWAPIAEVQLLILRPKPTNHSHVSKTTVYHKRGSQTQFWLTTDMGAQFQHRGAQNW